MFDDTTAFTTLDLSRPLPPHWQFATSGQRAALPLTILVALLVIVRVGRRLFLEVATDRGHEKLMELKFVHHLSNNRFLRPRWASGPAVAACAGVVVLPLLISGSRDLVALASIAGATVALTLAYQRTRERAAARSGHVLHHRSWPATAGLGLALAVVHIAVPPLPVGAHHKNASRRVHWAGPVLVMAMAAALVLLDRFTGVPLAHAAAAAALVMAAAAMIPVEPYDGAHLGHGLVPLLTPVGIAVVAALLETGVL